MICHALIPITDSSSVGEARREAATLCDIAKLSETDRGRVAIVVMELATNLVKHVLPSAGSILLTATNGSSTPTVEITSVDAGPGMNDLARCFEDGYSTGGTPGNGLGAIRRMTDAHDIFSAAGGTVIWCRVGGSRPTAARSPQLSVSGFSNPVTGETLCGDSWRYARSEDGRVSIIVADGLGHGPLAAEASVAACQLFESDPFAPPTSMLQTIHDAISGSRGAAISIAQIDVSAGKLIYAGVGNISGTLITANNASRGLFSHNGTVGHTLRKLQLFEYPLLSGDLVVLHSDGLQSRWLMDKYLGLYHRHPGVIAGILFRDFRRGRDDATVVAVASR